MTEKNEALKKLSGYSRLLKQTTVYWKVLVISIIAMIGVAATEVSFAALMKPLMDEAFIDANSAASDWIPIWLIIAFLVRAVTMFVSLYGMSWVGRQIILELRNRMFTTLLHLPKSFYDSATTGEIISKFIYDIEQVAAAATRAVTILVRDSFIVMGMIAWMFYLDAVLSAIFFVVSPLIVFLIAFVSKRFRNISKNIQTTMGGVSRVLEEAVKASIVVKIFGGQKYESNQFMKVNNYNRQQNMKMVVANALSTPITQLLVALAMGGVIYVATHKLFGTDITAGSFISFITAMVMMFGPIKRLTMVNEVIQRGIAASDSVFALIDLDKERDQGTLKVERVKGAIEFSDVSFSYVTANDSALKNISLKIKPYQTVAFVGRSGSGKSTLLNLIPRLYDTSTGCITIDGVNVNDYVLENLRQQISYVGQDVILFNDTIKHNIAYGSLHNVSDEKIEAAAKSAFAYDFIKDLKDGFDTVVGERGLMLSGGQRQRIAIARALLKDSPVLILDEATSALDTESERFIQRSLERLMKDRTTLVIAHRLSTIENADFIVVIDNGKIVEQGNHKALIEKNGYYSNLHKLQFSDNTAVTD